MGKGKEHPILLKTWRWLRGNGKMAMRRRRAVRKRKEQSE